MAAQAELGRDPEVQRLLDQALDDQKSSWNRGERVSVEDYLARNPALRNDVEAILDLIYREYLLRRDRGENPDPHEFFTRFPERAGSLMMQFGIDAAIVPSTEPRARRDESNIDLYKPSDIIDGFEIVGVLGRGGMSVVYKAIDRKLVRIVAIKTIAEVQHVDQEQRDRFMAEARAIARLKHPNIIPILAIGEVDGRPYFSLEYAEGGSLAQRLATGLLTDAEAAALIETLAQAVHAAHQAGIVHRDLKPSNVLLTAEGVPKVGDFGLAKLLDSESAHTLSGQTLGTPSFMSPEQAEGHSSEAGPAADVYSLGAILYQALTGRPPFLGGSAFETMKQVISTDVVHPRRLRPDLPRDLETICLKCLEKEPRKRYAGARDLAEDLRRFQDGRPIKARPASSPERAVRWCRRNPWVAASLSFLIVGSAVSTWQAVRATWAERGARIAEAAATTQRKRAESEAEIAKAVNDFLNKDVLGQASANNQASPDTKPDPDIKVRTALDRAAARIEGKFTGKPLVEASIRRAIGESYNQLGLYPEAQLQFERAVQLFRNGLHEDDPDTLDTMHHLGMLYLLQGKLQRAETLLLEVTERYDRVRGPEHPDSLGAMNTLGSVYFTQGKPKEAERLWVQSLVGVRKALGNHHDDTLNAANNLGLLYQTQGRLADAEPLLREAMEGFIVLRGAEHPDTLSAKHNLAGVYFLQDKLADAERLFEDVLNVSIRVLPDHPGTLNTKNDLGFVYEKQRRWVDSERMKIAVLEGRRRSLGPDHHDTLSAMSNLAVFYRGQKKLAEAESLFAEALERSRRVYGVKYADTLLFMQNLGTLYSVEGRLTEATSLLNEAVSGLRETLGPDHPHTLEAMSSLANLAGNLGKPAEAEPLLLHILDVRRGNSGAENSNTLSAMQDLATCYVSQGKYDLAEPLLIEALKGRRRKLDNNDPATVDTMDSLGWLLVRLGKFDAAEPLLRECVEIRKKTMPGDWQRYNTASLLGACLVSEKKFAEAEPMLISSYQGLKDCEKLIPPAQRNRVSEAAERVVHLYDAWGKNEKADAWRKKLSSSSATPPKP